MKYGVISYHNSDNLGDYIQTLSAQRFFEHQPSLFLRDRLHENPVQKHKVIINGWFMEQPQNWSPHPYVVPLFISFHLNPTVVHKLLTPEGVSYLKQFEPIGCRDFYTQRQLTAKGIASYFSACLTLSLKKNVVFPTSISKKSHILVLSVFERLARMGKPLDQKSGGVLQYLKSQFNQYRFRNAQLRLKKFLAGTGQEITYRSQILTPTEMALDRPFDLAKDQLEAIASASLVITSRIHTALPAVALGTPVLFLEDGLDHHNQNSRLEGLRQFFTCSYSRDLKKIQWQNITNPNAHVPYVKAMEEKIAQFLKTT